MWEFEGAAVAEPRFLVIGHGTPDTNAVGPALRAAQRRYFGEGGYLEQMIAHGPLRSDDGRKWVGDATLVELRDRAAVEVMLGSTPLSRPGCTRRLRYTTGSSAGVDSEQAAAVSASSAEWPPPQDPA